MKKKVFKLLTLFSAIFLLAACGGGGKSKDNTSSTAANEVYPYYAPEVYTYYAKSSDVTKEINELERELSDVLAYSNYVCDGECKFVRLNAGLNVQVEDGFSLAEGKDHPVTVIFNKSNDKIKSVVNVRVVKDASQATSNFYGPKEYDFYKADGEDHETLLLEQLQKLFSYQEVTVDGDDIDVDIHRDLDVSIADASAIKLDDESFDLVVKLVNPVNKDEVSEATITVYVNRDVSAQPAE